MRFFLIIILLVAIAGLGYFVVSSVFNGPSETQNGTHSEFNFSHQSGNSETVQLIDPEENSDTIEIRTDSGYVVVANNFRKIPGVESVGFNLYHLGTDSDFQILYNSEKDSFAVNISKQPVLQTRDRAVEALAQTLNVSQFELCQLNVYISTTFAFDPVYSGNNIGINGC